MTDHAIILSMIERVDPSDSAALDEIDALVEFYLLGEIFPRDESGRRRNSRGWHIAETVRYTRSRDMLKAIRPDGWFIGDCFYRPEKSEYKCSLYKPVNSFKGDGWAVADHLPTEELAELHAIIQAIAYERAQ